MKETQEMDYRYCHLRCSDTYIRCGKEGLRLLSDDTIETAWLAFGNVQSPYQQAVHDEWVRRRARTDPVSAARINEEWGKK